MKYTCTDIHNNRIRQLADVYSIWQLGNKITVK